MITLKNLFLHLKLPIKIYNKILTLYNKPSKKICQKFLQRLLKKIKSRVARTKENHVKTIIYPICQIKIKHLFVHLTITTHCLTRIMNSPIIQVSLCMSCLLYSQFLLFDINHYSTIPLKNCFTTSIKPLK